MSDNIVEADQLMGTAAAVIEKKARQLVYDSRYKLGPILKSGKLNPVEIERLLIQKINKSNAIPAVIARAKAMVSKKDNVKETYIPEIKNAATTSVAGALFKVFVEGVDPIIPDYLEELRGLDDKKYKIRVTDPKTNNSYVRYGTREKIEQLRQQGLKVELTEYGDPREDRAKKTSKTNDGNLANNYPPYNKVTRGDVIAGATGKDEMGGKNVKEELVGNQSKIDANGNNKIDGEDFKLLRKNKKEKGVAEDFLIDGTDSTEGRNTRMVTGKGVDNYANGTVTISPRDGAQNDTKGPQSPRGIYAHTEVAGEVIVETGYSKFLTMLNEKSVSQNQQQIFGLALSVKRGDTPRSEVSAEVLKIVDTMSEKEIRKFAKTKHKGLPEKKEMKEEMDAKCPKCGKCPCECDRRAVKTYRDLLKNKLRAVGLKNPIMLDAPDDEKVMDIMTKTKVDPMTVSASYEPEGESIEEAKYGTKAGRKRLAKKIRKGEDVGKPGGGFEEIVNKASKKVGKKRATKIAAAAMWKNLANSYEPEGEVIDERRREDKGKPRRPRNRAVEMVRGMNKEGMMTRSGKTIAQHERERGVPESDRPQRPEQTTADRLAAKKQRAAAQVAAAERSREEEDRRRRLA